MKRIIMCLLAAAMGLSLLPMATLAAANDWPAAGGAAHAQMTAAAAPNLDSASTWAQEGIQAAFEKGFVPADLQGQYASVITRQEFCRMAVRWVAFKAGTDIDAVMQAAGVSRDLNAFDDTSDPDILAAFALGITNGTGNRQFTPDGQLSREQAAVMIRNTCKVVGMDVRNVSSAGFSDIQTAAAWAVDSINFVRNARIMQGTGHNLYSPKATYTREQSIVTFGNIAFIGPGDLAVFADEVFRLANAEREKIGLDPFGQTAALTKAATVRADELILLYSHNRPDGTSWATALDDNHVDYTYAGENIAMGQQTAAEVMNDWMNSPGHRANILNADFGRLGVGVSIDANGRLYWAQTFTN